MRDQNGKLHSGGGANRQSCRASPCRTSLSRRSAPSGELLAAHVPSNTDTASLDKMLVDNVGDVTITNDGATILSLLEVTHPSVC